jgi:transcriptional regulator with XRE-family HTH domain
MPPRIGYQKSRPRRRTFIKEWREFRGLSQEALGARLETSGSMISRIENGETPYTQDTLEALAYFLQTEPASLLMRNPKDPDAIWELMEQGKPAQREKLAEFADYLKKTGTSD